MDAGVRPSPPHHGSTKYRADVDGLRAIAVLSVALYHAGLHANQRWLVGGYAGVDIFFVISGYLITKIIVTQIERGEFSLLDFWERRIRRILPALAAMLAATTIVASLILIPRDLRAFGQSLIATAMFSSNLYFRRKSGYFAGTADEQPLLHTWSLSVEEQFYVFWPILLLLAHWKIPRRLIAVTLLLWIASFGLAAWYLSSKAEAVFYYLPFRTWELLTGAILAFGRIPPLGSAAKSDGLVIVGLGMIGYSFATYAVATTPFPGPWALMPCLGAAFVIKAGENGSGRFGTMLGSLPLRSFGRISYAFYLWHWPVLVLARLYLLRPLAPLEAIGCLLVSALAATASTYFIEGPARTIREGRSVFVPRAVLYGVAGYAGIALVGATISSSNGFASYARPQVRALEAQLNADPERYGDCFQRPGSIRLERFQRCSTPGINGDTTNRIWLWGDSHAQALYPTIAAVMKPIFRGMRYRFVSSCSPLSDVDFVSRNSPEGSLTNCRKYIDQTLDAITGDKTISVVILAGRWTAYAEENLINPASQNYLLTDHDRTLDRPTSRNAMAFGLTKTLERLTSAGKKVIVVMPIPEFSFDPAVCYVRAIRLDRPVQVCEADGSAMRKRLSASEKIVTTASRDFSDVTVVATRDLLCNTPICRAWDNGGLRYHDSNHVTVHGADLLSARLTAAMKESQL